MAAAPKVVRVRTVNVPGARRNVNADEYSAMRRLLLKILPSKPPGLTQAEMAAAILPHLPEQLWPGGEKSMWWLKTVQTDLEAQGLVLRSTSPRPTRWWRVPFARAQPRAPAGTAEPRSRSGRPESRADATHDARRSSSRAKSRGQKAQRSVQRRKS